MGIEYIANVTKQFENVKELCFEGKWVDWLFRKDYLSNDVDAFTHAALKITNKCHQLRQIRFTDTCIYFTYADKSKPSIINLLRKLKQIEKTTLEVASFKKQFEYTL